MDAIFGRGSRRIFGSRLFRGESSRRPIDCPKCGDNALYLPKNVRSWKRRPSRVAAGFARIGCATHPIPSGDGIGRPRVPVSMLMAEPDCFVLGRPPRQAAAPQSAREVDLWRYRSGTHHLFLIAWIWIGVSNTLVPCVLPYFRPRCIGSIGFQTLPGKMQQRSGGLWYCGGGAQEDQASHPKLFVCVRGCPRETTCGFGQ